MVTVYTITQDGVVKYVGKTRNFTNRKCMHKKQRGTHKSAIPNDINLSTIEFHQIATFEKNDEAVKFEDEMILKYDTINNGWNQKRSGHIRVKDKNAYNRVWYNEHKSYFIALRQTPEHKSYMKEYEQRPEYKAYMKEYDKERNQTPERKAYLKAYHQTPEYKEYQRKYRLRKKRERAAV